MPAPEPLTARQVYHACPVELLDFATTEVLEDLEWPCGQERALRALEFGTAIGSDGFNLYLLGSSRVGMRETAQRFLARRAASEDVPPDWCHVYNFDAANRPRALRLPAGDGRRLKSEIDAFVDELRENIPAIFESEEYQSRLHELREEIGRQQNEGMRTIQEEANEHNIALLSTPTGFTLAPVRDGEVLEPEKFQQLPDDERQHYEEKIEELQKKLQQTIQKVPRLRKQLQEKIRSLNEEMVLFTLGGPMRELKDNWSHVPAVIDQLDAVRQDVVDNAMVFHGGDGNGPPDGLVDRYRVNLLVDNAETRGAPVVYEDLPSHQHLVGLIEHHVSQGALYTDFSLIRPGALHRANGGYLLLDVRRVLTQPLAWESLKRILFSGEIRIESLERLYGLVSTVSLQPEPIPVSVKIVLLGDRLLYYLLARHDPDFLELFKVEADFEDEVDRTRDGHELYARMIATMARRAELRPIDRGGVARVIEHASRLADDQQKLTAHDRELRDLLMEADHWAGEASADLVGAEHVEQAVTERIHRADRVHQRSIESIRRGIRLIATKGERIAQINGLSVFQLGAFAFGQPSRITATARPGKGQVVDIEREAKLGGPIHSKGVMILSRFLAHRFAGQSELSLSASLAFEQSYGGVEGDSASVAEACALLSAIARVPLKQTLAVTGSVNQHGEVQAVGGVNQKVEGFFDVCREAGELDGHAVVLPASNVEHLMLRRDVRDAVEQDQFRIYPITTIDDALALLTDRDPGEADSEGSFPADSFNRLVADRLAEFAEIGRRRHSGSVEGQGEQDRDDG